MKTNGQERSKSKVQRRQKVDVLWCEGKRRFRLMAEYRSMMADRHVKTYTGCVERDKLLTSAKWRRKAWTLMAHNWDAS